MENVFETMAQITKPTKPYALTLKIMFTKSEMDYAETRLKIVHKEPVGDDITLCTIELTSPTSAHEIWHTAIGYYLTQTYKI